MNAKTNRKELHVGSHLLPLKACFALSIECSSFIINKRVRFALQYSEICYFICKNLINKSCLNEFKCRLVTVVFWSLAAVKLVEYL